jgi:hypothetical protein
MNDLYVDNPRNQTSITNLHYYRVNLFYTVIDIQLREPNYIFMKINTEILICMSCLGSKNSFSSFNKERLLQLAQIYPSDFKQFEFPILACQLKNYIMNVQVDRDFFEVNLVELSQKLVETNRHNICTLVYKLIKLGLLLSVATASVKRVFFGNEFGKNQHKK